MTDVFTLQESDNIRFIKSVLQKHILDLNIWRVGIPTDDIIIAGGYFATMLDVGNQRYNDIDVFILNNNRSVYDRLTYVNEPDPKGHVWSINTNTNYLKNPHVESVTTNKTTKVQYILTDFRTRKELLEDFDFVHCTVSYDCASQNLYITRQAYDCIMKKELRDNKKEHAAQWRINKFNQRGWNYIIKLENIKQPVSALDALVQDCMKIVKASGLPSEGYSTTSIANQYAKNIPTGSFTIEKDDLEAVRKLLT